MDNERKAFEEQPNHVADKNEMANVALLSSVHAIIGFVRSLDDIEGNVTEQWLEGLRGYANRLDKVAKNYAGVRLNQSPDVESAPAPAPDLNEFAYAHIHWTLQYYGQEAADEIAKFYAVAKPETHESAPSDAVRKPPASQGDECIASATAPDYAGGKSESLDVEPSDSAAFSPDASQGEGLIANPPAPLSDEGECTHPDCPYSGTAKAFKAFVDNKKSRTKMSLEDFAKLFHKQFPIGDWGNYYKKWESALFIKKVKAVLDAAGVDYA